MTRISPDAMVHQLKADLDHPPVKQRRRKFAPERNRIVNEEIEKLLSNGMSKKFDWNPSCEEALQQLKRYLTTPPLLSKPVDVEKLYSYLAVSETAISAVLVREEESKQLPVYYVSKSFLDAETRYSQLEKLVLALIHASKKLRPYFQCHSIVVITSFPLKKILHKPELSGRLMQWTIELSEFDIVYQSRTAIKSWALADFIADFTPSATTQAERELLCMNIAPPSKWTLLVDGSSNVNGNGLGIVLIAPEGDIVQRAIRCGFKCTNNKAEYEALLAGLNLAREIGAKRLEVKSDSQLVVNQLQGTYQARDSKMTSYLSMVKELQAQFEEFSIVQIPRAENYHADALANLGSALPCYSQSSIPLLFMQWPANWKEQPPNKSPVEAMGIEQADCWMTPVVRYLENDELPADKNEARRLKASAARFTIHEGQLLRKSFSGPYLKCISPEEAQSVLAELHKGECGNHTGGRSLAHRVITAGYYWPTIRTDSTAYVKKCDSCQRRLSPIMDPSSLAQASEIIVTTGESN
ncbi:uncharacterized protein LOC116129327 [Pistacia vera]|uniref:uncharacterized protein LOC116129327 n=1 Tax=Pistacia vera TaxID=55513 RepID=UPI001262B7EA|nr:uncharacterized protein LOC116129327 [Pistacia vera]